MHLHPLVAYAYIGLLIFAFLVFWRVFRRLQNGPGHFQPDKAPHPTLGEVSYTFIWVTMLGVCLIAWPAVLYIFIDASGKKR